MSERYTYRPPLGFDIRVKPERDPDREAATATHHCEWEGCDRAGPHRAPVSPTREGEYRWFCQDHARQYNRAWNFFADMNDEEIAEYQEAAIHGNRPTWSMGANAWAKDGRANPPPGFVPGKSRPRDRGARFTGGDAYGFFEDLTQGEPASERRRHVPKLQRQALETLDLPETASLNDVKQRYKELVKRFHPDANGGDRGAEDRLRQVINAYRTLRAANFR